MLLTTIAFVVFTASILVFFSEELVGFVKKLMTNKFLCFVTPLFFMSFLYLSFEQQITDYFLSLRIFLFYLVLNLAMIMPFPGGLALEKVLILIFVATTLIFIIQHITRRIKLKIDLGKIMGYGNALVWVLISALLVLNL